MSDGYHYKMEESEAGEYPLYCADRKVGEILYFDHAKFILDKLKGATQSSARTENTYGKTLIAYPGDKIEFRDPAGQLTRIVIVEHNPQDDVSYEVVQDDQPVAGASGPNAMGETLNYAAQYVQDGPVEIVEVRRKVINRLEKP